MDSNITTVAALQHSVVIHDLGYPALSHAMLVGLQLHAMKMSGYATCPNNDGNRYRMSCSIEANPVLLQLLLL